MTSIETTFTIGTDATFESLTIVRLLGESAHEPAYDTLDAALARGTLQIMEVTESGHVPEIEVKNHGQRPVLIIDGEELVGAKQNRTVNLSILIPAAADIIVPVTCVEAGRWSDRSRRFTASPRTHFAAGRAAKSAQVSESLLRAGVARADQSQVWHEIAEKSARLQAYSETSAMSDIFEQRADTVEAFVRALPVAEHQVGAVFILNGEANGMDLFDSPRTFRALIPKIVRGYALDAIDPRFKPGSGGPSALATGESQARAKRFVRQVLDAPRTPFAAPGIGETWRLFAPELSGGGLSRDGDLVHLSAFRTSQGLRP